MSLRINSLAGFRFDRDSGTLSLDQHCKLIWAGDLRATREFIDYIATDSLTRLTLRINRLRQCDLATQQLLYDSITVFSRRTRRSIVIISSDDSSLQRHIVSTARKLLPTIDLAFDGLDT